MFSRSSPPTPPQPPQPPTPPLPNPELVPLFEIASRDRAQLQRVIQVLSITTNNKPLVNKLRCMAAVDDFEKLTQRVERKQKARKLVSVFVHPGSMFHIQDIPSSIAQALLRDGEDFASWLVELKRFCLCGLLESKPAVQAVKDTVQFGAQPSVVRTMAQPHFGTKRDRDLTGL